MMLRFTAWLGCSTQRVSRATVGSLPAVRTACTSCWEGSGALCKASSYAASSSHRPPNADAGSEALAALGQLESGSKKHSKFCSEHRLGSTYRSSP
eukprot:6204121-Pleurochrysis_carterae.AAC.2